MLTSLYSLSTSLVSVTGFYTEDEPYGAYDKNEQVFEEKQKVFTLGKRAEMSNLEAICSMNR